VGLIQIVRWLVRASIFANVAALGAGSKIGDALSVLRTREQLLRAFVAMQLVWPLCTVLMVRALPLSPPVKIALVALSISPLPPLLPRKASGAREAEGYAVGLLTAMALVSLVWIPIVLELLERVFSVPLQLTPWLIGVILVETIALPLGAGMLARRLWPRFAERLVRPATAVGGVLLLLGALLIVVRAHAALWQLLGDGTLLTILVWTTLGLAVGHWLGGPGLRRRAVLAVATSSRHPAVAIAIAQQNFPEQKLAPAAVLLALLASAFVTGAYVAWIKRRAAVLAVAAEHHAH